MKTDQPPPHTPWGRLLNLTCADAARLVAEGLDRPLPLRERFFLRIHLLLCKWCRRYRRQIRLIRGLLAVFCSADAPSDLIRMPEPARQRIAQRLRE